MTAKTSKTSTGSDRTLSTILVTGGCGFIGANFIHYLLGETGRAEHGFAGRVINLDALTYAGNPANLAEIAESAGDRYRFVHGDITDTALLKKLFAEEPIDTIVHLAAESHVDRSIHGPQAFVETNVMGTFALLEAARAAWIGASGEVRDGVLFHHVSTDEVFGSLGEEGYFLENTSYDPRSPYSASKASSDHLVRAYFHTYGLPITLTNCSNNYGPYQFPEKLIPVMILNILDGKPLPVYGDGKNIRDWLYVEDHNRAVWAVMQRGETGESYNIGGDNEWENITLVETLCDIVAEEIGGDPGKTRELITFVKDRPGHDRRYAIDCTRLKNELGWKQTVDFAEGLRRTVRWYLDNPAWIEGVRSGAYREWVETNYGGR
jgi:dTDP-glucose 4,6-dehydratase